MSRAISPEPYVADGVTESQVAENSIAAAGKEVAAGSTTTAEGRCG